jgi:hypothetical protein
MFLASLLFVEPLVLSPRKPWYLCCTGKEEGDRSSCVGGLMNCHDASETYKSQSISLLSDKAHNKSTQN